MRRVGWTDVPSLTRPRISETASTASESATTLSSSQRIGVARSGSAEEVAEAVEKRPAALRQHSGLAHLVELAKEVPLPLRQLRRDHDVDDDVQVAAAGAAQPRDALPPQADLGAGLRTGGHLHLFAALHRGHLEGRAQRRLRERARELVVELGPTSRELRVVADLDRDVQVAVGSAPRPGLTLPFERDPLSAVDAGRNRDLED